VLAICTGKLNHIMQLGVAPGSTPLSNIANKPEVLHLSARHLYCLLLTCLFQQLLLLLVHNKARQQQRCHPTSHRQVLHLWQASW
jgi:hypothetical protein